MKNWNHKFPNLPSCSFMQGHLAKYQNKRFRFLLLNTKKFSSIVSRPFLVGIDKKQVQLNPDKPIYINAIYTHLFKKSKLDGNIGDWGMRVRPEDMTFKFIFRDVVFEQDGKQYFYPFGRALRLRPRAANKTKAWSFDLKDIGSCPLVNELRTADILRMMELHVVSY